METEKLESSKFLTSMEYLFDPLAVLIHAAVHIKEYQADPRSLCPKLGITPAQMKEILRKLDRNGYLRLAETGPNLGFRITEVRKGKIHYGRDHVLMRVHQNLLKTALNSQLIRTEETEKHSFQATFTTGPAGFEEIKSEFQGFLKKVEAITRRHRHEGVYQLCFDLFKWL